MRKREGRVCIIPTSSENFFALSVGRVLFLDSYQLTKGSLEAMVSELADEDFGCTKKAFGSEEKFAMITRKGVFLYSMMSEIEQLTNPKEIAFPSKENFFNKLSFHPVEPGDYALARKSGKRSIVEHCEITTTFIWYRIARYLQTVLKNST